MADKPKRDGESRERGATYQAPALDKGIDILEHLSDQGEALSLADLAKALGRSKNEIYRMAVVLERRGYLERTPDDRFGVSNRLFQLGIRNPPVRNLLDAALPAMHALAEALEQSCHLAVASGDDMVVVARVESPGLLGFAVRVGYRRHIVEATSGRVLFGLQPEERQARWLPSLRQSAPRGADVPAFLDACEAARRAGHAVADSSFVLGVTDVAAPVYDGAEVGPLASLTMPFLARRDRSGDVATATAALADTAAQISGRLTNG